MGQAHGGAPRGGWAAWVHWGLGGRGAGRLGRWPAGRLGIWGYGAGAGRDAGGWRGPFGWAAGPGVQLLSSRPTYCPPPRYPLRAQATAARAPRRRRRRSGPSSRRPRCGWSLPSPTAWTTAWARSWRLCGTSSSASAATWGCRPAAWRSCWTRWRWATGARRLGCWGGRGSCRGLGWGGWGLGRCLVCPRVASPSCAPGAVPSCLGS